MVLLYVLFLHRSVGGEVTQDGDFLLFEGNRYDRRGFLYKNFVMSAIVSNLSCNCAVHSMVHKFFTDQSFHY